MKLQRVSSKDPKAVNIVSRLNTLTDQGIWHPFKNPDLELDITPFAIQADIKQSNYACAISITNIKDKTSQTWFVKQAAEDEFTREKQAIANLKNTKASELTNICYPIFFDDADRLIISPYAQGKNAKWILRDSLLRLRTKKHQATESAYKAYGNWLAGFHAHTKQTQDFEKATGKELFYPARHRLIKSVSNSEYYQVVDHLIDKLGLNKIYSAVHGDFGPHNIMQDQGGFSVIDWEKFCIALSVTDCIDFTTSVLTQLRHQPYSSHQAKNLIGAFLNSYAKACALPSSFTEVVTLIAISNIYKRQEWAQSEFSVVNKLSFLPTLRKLASSSFTVATKIT